MPDRLFLDGDARTYHYTKSRWAFVTFCMLWPMMRPPEFGPRSSTSDDEQETLPSTQIGATHGFVHPSEANSKWILIEDQAQLR